MLIGRGSTKILVTPAHDVTSFAVTADCSISTTAVVCCFDLWALQLSLLIEVYVLFADKVDVMSYLIVAVCVSRIQNVWMNFPHMPFTHRAASVWRCASFGIVGHFVSASMWSQLSQILVRNSTLLPLVRLYTTPNEIRSIHFSWTEMTMQSRWKRLDHWHQNTDT